MSTPLARAIDLVHSLLFEVEERERAARAQGDGVTLKLLTPILNDRKRPAAAS